MTPRPTIPALLLAVLLSASATHAQLRYTPQDGYRGTERRPAAETDSLLARYNHAVTLYEQKRYGDAIDLAEELIDEDVNRKSPLLEPLYFYMGRAQMDDGQLREAVETFEILLKRFPYTNFLGEVYQFEFEIAKQYLDGSYKFRLLGIPFSMKPTGRALVEKLLERAPYSPFAAEAQYLVAMYYYDERDYRSAELSFQQVTRLYPDTEYARRARYYRAMALMRNSAGPRYGISNTRDAEILFAEYLSDYPDSESAAEVRKQLQLARNLQAEKYLLVGKFYRNRGKSVAAARYYRLVLETPRFAETPAAQEARQTLIGTPPATEITP